jgi:hypothetical protein
VNCSLTCVRSIAAASRSPQASVTAMWIYPKSVLCLTVGSIPISRATPTITNEFKPQLRRVMSKNVPANADTVILSATASLGSGASSRRISMLGESRAN